MFEEKASDSCCSAPVRGRLRLLLLRPLAPFPPLPLEPFDPLEVVDIVSSAIPVETLSLISA